MHNRFFFFTLLLLLCTLAITVSRPAAEPVATPTPPPETVLTTSATPSPLPAGRIEQTALLALAPFTITFPAPWSLLWPERNGWAQQLQSLQETKPELASDLEAIGAMADDETAVALAWPPSTVPQPGAAITLVAAVTPAENLTLSTYLNAITDTFASAALVAQPHITVTNSSIRYDLHEAGLPVAILHYVTADVITGETSTAAPPTTHYQAVLLDKSGEKLLLLTFVIRDAEPTAALAIINAIVATIQQN